jgi:hypothetical protein
MKRIAFLGNFKVSYSTESHHLKTYRDLGFDVVALQENEASASEILTAAMQSDYFCWTHTHGWKTDGIESVLSALKNKGIPSYGYHLDLWLGLEREKDLKSDPFWGVEYFFSVDKLMVEHLSKSHGPKTFFLPAGVFQDECVPGSFRKEFAYDVVFVGSKSYHHEWPYRSKLIEWLEKTFEDRFALFGPQGKGVIRGSELNDLYASAKIVIGDTLCKDFDYPYYLSDRVFETTGRGGFMIHPYIRGIEQLFDVHQELVVYPFNHFEYLRYLIEYYCKHDALRMEILRAGHDRTVREHTYAHRLQQLLNTIDLDRA